MNELNLKEKNFEILYLKILYHIIPMKSYFSRLANNNIKTNFKKEYWKE